jgi:hypothetical protein
MIESVFPQTGVKGATDCAKGRRPLETTEGRQFSIMLILIVLTGVVKRREYRIDLLGLRGIWIQVL